MVQYNVQVDDASPIVEYSGEWSTTPPSEGASSLVQYHDATVHSTTTNSSSASITFRGTSVTIYGSRSQQAANFIVTLDGTAQQVSGFAESTQYQQSLFSASNLPFTFHSLRIERADPGEKPLALDYFEWTTGLNDNIANARFTIDDANSTISYNPTDAWSTSSVTSNQSVHLSVHSSSTNGATVTIPFAGDAVYLYGPAGAFGQMSVTVDGRNKTEVNCTSSVAQSKALLFYLDGFPSGEHTLELTVNGTSGVPVAFDYVDVIRWSDNNGLGQNKAKTPIIAGTVCGAVIFLAWIIYLGLWYYKRRKRNAAERQRKIDDAIIAAAHPNSHPNASGDETSSPRSGEQPKRPPVKPLASEHPSEAKLLEAPESNSAAHFTNGVGANQEKGKSAV